MAQNKACSELLSGELMQTDEQISNSVVPVDRILLDAHHYLAEIYQHPGVFARKVLQMTPTPQQDELFDAIAEGHKRIGVRSGHGVGKTSGLGIVVLWYLGTRPSCLIVCTATTEDQLKHQLWREMRIWASKAIDPWFSNFEIESRKAYRKDNPEGAVAIMRVARKDKPENAAGFHHDHLLEIVDEGSAVDDIFYEAVDGCLTKPDNQLITAGNPTRLSGQFHRAFHTESHKWKTLHFSSLDSPLVDENYGTDIADKYGEQSNIYRIKVLGEFAKSESDALILLEWIEAAAGRAADDRGDEIIIGVDPGRSTDKDASGIIARSGHRVLAVKQVWERDLMKVAGHAKEFKRQVTEAWPSLPWGYFAVDVIGLGAGTHDSLKEQGEETVEVDVSKPAPDLWDQTGPKPAGMRDHLWLEARDFIKEGGSIRGLEGEDCEILKSELSGPKYSLNSKGEIVVESKKSMKKRGLHSPNLADALCLTFAPKESGNVGWVASV